MALKQMENEKKENHCTRKNRKKNTLGKKREKRKTEIKTRQTPL